MTENRPIRVGIVGAGDNTRRHHIPKLRAQPNVEIVSVVNRSLESSQRAADELAIPTVYANWRDLIYAEDSNAIVIGTWPYIHHPLTLAALDAGKHVMVEARMAMNAAQAREMAAAAAQRPDLITQIVPAPMSLHLDRTIKRLIAEDYLGDLLAVSVVAQSGFVDYDAPFHWRQDTRLSGLNIMGLGIYYEMLMRWVGPARTVMAMGKTVVKMRKNAAGQAVATAIPDHIDIIADMVCGAQLNLSMSQVTGLASDPGSITLFGSEGTLQIRDWKLFGGRRGDSAMSNIAIPEAEHIGWRVEEEFVNAIRGVEAISHTTFSDGVAYMDFIEAVHRSMAKGRAIALPLH